MQLNAPEQLMKEFVPRSEYSWAHKDVLELKGPLPADFTLATDVTIKPEVFPPTRIPLSLPLTSSSLLGETFSCPPRD